MRRKWSGSREVGGVMAHDTAGVTSMQDPTKRFGQIVGWIDHTRDVTHHNIARVLPILDRKMLDHDMPGTFGGYAGIHHINGRFVIAIQRGGGSWWQSEFGEDGTEIAGLFGGGDGGIEFGLRRTGCRGGLRFAFVGNATTSKEKSKASGGAALTEVIGVRSIQETREISIRLKSRKIREYGREGFGTGVIGTRWERGIKGRAMIVYAPMFGAPKIFGHFLEHSEVEFRGRRGKFTECDGRIADVWSTSDIGIENFT